MTKNLRSINPSEHQIQSAIVEWSNSQRIIQMRHNKVPVDYLTIGDFLIAIKNEGKQKTLTDKNGNKFCPTGKRFNREGRKRGVSDLFLAYPIFSNKNCVKSCEGYRTIKSGLWMEVKTKKGKLSIYQYEWLKRMKTIDYDVAVVRSVEEGIQVIKDYLGIK